MKERALLIAWVGGAVVFVLLLLWGVNSWRSVSTRGAQARTEREGLTREIRLKEEEIVKVMNTHGALLREMQWTSAGGDPSTFLTRLADLAQGSRMKITAIGPLERRATAQFNKSWHTIQVTAPYRDVRELATRVEREKGILEDMVLDVPAPGSAPTQAQDEIHARFRMTALEITAEARRILDRALAASRTGPTDGAGTTGSLALPVPPGASAGRDPFTFGTAPAPPRVAAKPRPGAAAAPPPEPRPVEPLAQFEVKGIVGFPGGALAILNDQIVKVGDEVSGHRVERIGEQDVVLRQPDGKERTVVLNELSAVAPQAPRR